MGRAFLLRVFLRMCACVSPFLFVVFWFKASQYNRTSAQHVAPAINAAATTCTTRATMIYPQIVTPRMRMPGTKVPPSTSWNSQWAWSQGDKGWFVSWHCRVETQRWCSLSSDAASAPFRLDTAMPPGAPQSDVGIGGNGGRWKNSAIRSLWRFREGTWTAP